MKVTFIGGCSKTQSGHGGETLKNTHILNYLKAKGCKVNLLDTVEGKKNLILFFFKVLVSFLDSKSKKVILSSATVTSIKFLKLSKYLNVWNKPILYFVIGGTLLDSVNSKKSNFKALKYAKKIFIESKHLSSELIKLGFYQTSYLPNFKPLLKVNLNSTYAPNEQFKILYLSRVMPTKGIEILINVVVKLNSKGYKLSLDVYGPIEKNYENDFRLLIKTNEKIIKYNGVLDFINNTKAYNTIAAFDLFVLPTFHYGEGFPGVFIDCFIAGLPVLTTDWNFNNELINDSENGFLIPPKSEVDLYNKIQFLLENKNILLPIREANKRRAFEYELNFVLDSVFI